MSSSTKRVLLALLSVGISGLVAWLSRDLSKGDGHRGFWSKAFLLSVRIGIVMMLISFLANVFGYFGLSQVITEGVLFGAYYAVVLYTSREVLRIVSSVLLRTETALRSTVIRNHRVRINSWFFFIITLIACVAWVSSILRLFTVRDDLVDSLKTALTTPIVSGTNSFTAANVLSFILVIIIGLIVATIVRVVLREDVLKRLPVRQGVPFAVSMVTYYLMLFFVFVLALVAAGVELSKFTLFTGAFGIGVGFGLQNTINNFASGLILLFERPIRETDILEVDGAFGEVTRIGMRSTSLRTAQEAEVIIPNSTLVAGKVINWSRLGRRRPVELLVRVAYGADPREVIDLLVKTAAAQSDVLRDPAPSAFLQRFGERSLEFMLVLWVGRYHLHRKVLSEVAVSVTTNFREAGIQMPGSDKESLVRNVSGNDHELAQDQTSSVTKRESPVDARATDQHN